MSIPDKSGTTNGARMNQTLTISVPAGENSELQLVASMNDSADRFTHEYRLDVDGQVTTLLRSVEDFADAIWPVSPPLQELTRHELPDGPALLGVGMAGTSHWSVSFAASEDQLSSDFACLTKSSPEFLGGTWKVADGIAIEQVDAANFRLSIDDRSFDFAIVTPAEPGDGSDLTVTGSRIVIGPRSLDRIGQFRWGLSASCCRT